MADYNDFNSRIFFEDHPDEIRHESRCMSRVFFGFIAAYVLATVFVLTSFVIISALELASEVEDVLLSFVQMLLVPLAYFMTLRFTSGVKSYPHPVMDKMTSQNLSNAFAVSFFIMIGGSMAGRFVNNVISNLTGDYIDNIVSSAVENMSIYEIIISVVIVGPFFEELLFRKLLIDKLAKYGTPFSAFVSSFIFAIIHGNFEQFFYAFGIGLVFAYVYCIYGKVIYTIILHCLINAIGSLAPYLIGALNGDFSVALQYTYTYAYLALAVSGGIILAKNLRKSKAYMVGGALISPYRALFKSRGFYVMLLFLIAEFLISFGG